MAKATPIPSPDKSRTAESMALAALKEYLNDVLDNLSKAAGKRPKQDKYVHDLRVASRRSQAALALYADFLPPRRKDRLEKRLKAIRAAARDPRDLDVLIDLLTQDKTDAEAGALIRLAQKSRDRAQKRLTRAIGKARDRDFAQDVKKFLKDVERRQSRNGMRFAPWARIELRPAAREFFAAAPALAAEAKLKELHKFRIRAKYLRYTMEMLQPAFPEAFRKQLLPRVEELQERLGEIIDIAARRQRFETWLKKTEDETLAHHLREHIALDASRLAQARADFGAWCTPAFMRRLKASFDALLAELTLVAPARVKAAS